MKKTSSKLVIKLAVAAVVIIVGIVGAINFGGDKEGAESYEELVQEQVDAINEKNVKKYLNNYTEAGRTEYEADTINEYMNNLGNLEYEIVDIEYLSNKDFFEDEHKIGDKFELVEGGVDLDLDVKTSNGFANSSMRFKAVCIDGRWYSITNLAGSFFKDFF